MVKYSHKQISVYTDIYSIVATLYGFILGSITGNSHNHSVYTTRNIQTHAQLIHIIIKNNQIKCHLALNYLRNATLQLIQYLK